MRSRLSSASLLCLSACLAGCAAVTAPSPVAGKTFRSAAGAVFGGQQPVSGATVTLFLAGTTGYGSGATAAVTSTGDTVSGVTTPYGNFTLPQPACPDPNAPTYVLAQGGDAGSGPNASLVLAAALGPCASVLAQPIAINEVTTVAAAFALSHFFTSTLGSGSADSFGAPAPAGQYNAGLFSAARYTVPVLVNGSTGSAHETNTAGGLTTTLESAKLYSLANTLATCVNSTGATGTSETTTPCGQLFAMTATPGSSTGAPRPADTLQAAVQMALYPYQNVSGLFNLGSSTPPFIGLSTTPNDLTLAVSYSTSATPFSLAINADATSSTSSNIDIDAAGNVWFPSTNASGLGMWSPATNSFNGPYLTALVHPQYLAIDSAGTVWGTDLTPASAQVLGTPTATPGQSTATLATATGTSTGPIAGSRASSSYGGLAYSVSATGNGSATIVTYDGTQQTSNAQTNNAPTGLAVESYNNMLYLDAATSGSNTACDLEEQLSGVNAVPNNTAPPCLSGGVADSPSGEVVVAASVMSSTPVYQLCTYFAKPCFTPDVPLSLPQGIAVDGGGNLWIANAGNGSVSTLFYSYKSGNSSDYVTTSPIAYLHDASHGNTVSRPYGIAIDRSGNVWLSNASCAAGVMPCTAPFVLSELVGAAVPTITPLSMQTLYGTGATRPQAQGSIPRRR